MPTATSEAEAPTTPITFPPMSDVEGHQRALMKLATSEKSCDDCVFFLSPGNSAKVTGKSIGSPTCGKYGVPLAVRVVARDGEDATALNDRKDTVNTQLRKRVAATCGNYSKPGDPENFDPVKFNRLDPAKANIQVGTKHAAKEWHDRVNAEANKHPAPAKGIPRACSTCMFYVPEQHMATQFGWQVGGCSKYGKLIYTSARAPIAAGCDSYSPFQWKNSQTAPLAELEVRELYLPSYYDIDAFFKYGSDIVHPSSYATDSPVTDEDAKRGIIAWRHVPNPSDADTYVRLPVYSPDILGLTESERAMIPQPGDDEHPELYLDYGNNVYKVAAAWYGLDETVMAWGAAGVGKTELFRHLAYLMQLPFYRFNLNGATEVDDLMGTKELGIDPNTGKQVTFFRPGRFPTAWSRPSITLLDEPNSASDDIWMALRPVTDNSKQLVLEQSAKGGRVTRHREAKLAMAANPSWDPRNIGTKTIGDADSSRLMHIFMDLPAGDLERKIITERVKLDGWELPKATLDQIMAIASDLRSMSEEQTIPITWGMRTQIKVARASRWFTLVEAFHMAVDSLEPQAVQHVLDAVRTHVPDPTVTAKGRKRDGTGFITGA